jgi:hypothetical protein
MGSLELARCSNKLSDRSTVSVAGPFPPSFDLSVCRSVAIFAIYCVSFNETTFQ